MTNGRVSIAAGGIAGLAAFAITIALAGLVGHRLGFELWPAPGDGGARALAMPRDTGGERAGDLTPVRRPPVADGGLAFRGTALARLAAPVGAGTRRPAAGAPAPASPRRLRTVARRRAHHPRGGGRAARPSPAPPPAPVAVQAPAPASVAVQAPAPAPAASVPPAPVAQAPVAVASKPGRSDAKGDSSGRGDPSSTPSSSDRRGIDKKTSQTSANNDAAAPGASAKKVKKAKAPAPASASVQPAGEASKDTPRGGRDHGDRHAQDGSEPPGPNG